jgi:hypothetical protein
VGGRLAGSRLLKFTGVMKIIKTKFERQAVSFSLHGQPETEA